MNSRNLLLSIFSVIISITVVAQPLPLSYAVSQGGGSAYVYGRDVCSDANGNAYNIGTFGGTIDLDPGTGQYNVTSPTGGSSVYVSKLDVNGDFVWGFMLSSPNSSNVEGNAIALDNNGNVYITGQYQTTVDFDPSANTASLTAEGLGDVYVAKYSTAGNYIWARSMGGVSEDIAFGIAVDNASNVFTTGHFYQTADFDPGASTVNLSSEGGSDAFISKLDVNGDFAWVKQIGDINDEYAGGIDIDGNNDIVAVGTFWAATAFDPTGVNQQLTSNGKNDVWVSKLNGSTGNIIFLDHIGGPESETGICVTTDFNNDIVIGGNFRGTVDFDNSTGVAQQTMLGNYDAFVLKLTATGSFTWVNHFGGTDNEAVRGVDTDPSGNVFTTGFFKSTVDFNINGAQQNITSAGDADIFITEHDMNGGLTWVHSFGGTNADLGNGLYFNADALYLIGQFSSSTVDFDPSTATYNLSPVGSIDAYTVRLGCSPTSGIDIQTACDSYTWIDGNTYTSDNNTATHTLTNAAGCDSVVTLDLTINNSTTGTDVQTACDSYIWIDGNTYTSDNNTATFTLTNVVGCDSVVTLDLTIQSSPSVSITQNGVDLTADQSGANYEWYSCDDLGTVLSTDQTYTATANGEYLVSVSLNGCTDDSQCVQVTTVGLTTDELETVSVYPNPSEGLFKLQSEKTIEGYKVYNTQGKLIIVSNTSSKSTTIDLRNESKGLYFLHVNESLIKLSKQ